MIVSRDSMPRFVPPSPFVCLLGGVGRFRASQLYGGADKAFAALGS